MKTLVKGREAVLGSLLTYTPGDAPADPAADRIMKDDNGNMVVVLNGWTLLGSGVVYADGEPMGYANGKQIPILRFPLPGETGAASEAPPGK
ncbi:hypothetical protein [Gemmata sp.]|uniref:hypothetical protein n=1 Tax=Gemmata sp. TaxID=1914242 RepID=UPI003F6FF52F